MTTDRGRVTAWLASLSVVVGVWCALCGVSCAGQSSIRHGDTLDVSSYPEDMRKAYKIFEVRCSKCHTLARPLNARVNNAQHWVHYVDRMRHNPASGINAKNGEIILKFLIYYMHQRQADARAEEVEADKLDQVPADAGQGQPDKAPTAEPATPPPSAARDSAAPAPEQPSVEKLAVPPESVSEPASAEKSP